MASSLSLQLAQIRVKGVNPLDLKAQKREHSRSLLFDPRIAAVQDFDTIFLLCNEGFQELCQLDTRFILFSQTVFSEQSKYQDRAQMTVQQNDQLNILLEDFLGLIGNWLHLKPALKAIEWLVRRFRIQYENTLCLVLTFLPFHTTQIFRKLLAILPESLPPVLRFLHPYIRSVANPPRHTIVSTLIHNNSLFAEINSRVLKVCKVGHHYPALLSFWAATITEGLAGMLDQSRLGRWEAQRRHQGDAMFRIIPTLHDGLGLENVPELQQGCFMILTMLATRVVLQNEVLAVLMEAVASTLTRASSAGLICLASLAQQREVVILPNLVLRTLLNVEKLDEMILVLKARYRVDRIILGVILGILGELHIVHNVERVSIVRSFIESDSMDDSLTVVAIKAILFAARNEKTKHKKGSKPKSSLIDLLLSLAKKEKLREMIQRAVQTSDLELDVRLKELIPLNQQSPGQNHENIEVESLGSGSITKTYEEVAHQIAIKIVTETSFLSHSDSDVFENLASAFILASSSAEMTNFSDLPVLRKPSILIEPLYISFFIRIWCGGYPAPTRAAALKMVADSLVSRELVTDLQILLPYLLYGLADPVPTVRQASAQVVATLLSGYNNVGNERRRLERPVLGQEQIYGWGPQSSEVLWLSADTAARFLEDILASSLEECLLDANHILQLVSNSLRSVKRSKASQNIFKELKTAPKQAIFAFLCSHVISTPIYTVKYRLLAILNQIEKVGSLSRTKALLPMLSRIIGMNQENFKEIADTVPVSTPELLDRLFEAISPADREGIHLLQSLIKADQLQRSHLFVLVAHRRIRVIWSCLKADPQLVLANILLEEAARERANNDDQWRRDEALNTLRILPLSPLILEHFMENLSASRKCTQDKPHATKRRQSRHAGRDSYTDHNPQTLALKLKKLALVLELIESNNTKKQPQLMKGLFEIMDDLQQLNSPSGLDLGYLQVLAMGNILTIVKELPKSSPMEIEYSIFKPNVLVDCLRTTVSPQVQQVALLLLAGLASLAPKLVLHSVVPIFTFMGATTLRQNDEYSAYVVDQTMESVIPSLIESLHMEKNDTVVGALDLMISFVAAFKHIPAQRQLFLFKSLTDKLGPADFLFAILILLLDRYPDDPIVVCFAGELAGSYGGAVQLQTVDKFLSVNLDSLKPNPSISRYLMTIERYGSAEAAIARILPLLSMIFRGKRLIRTMIGISKKQEADAVLMQTLYTRSLEQMILLITRSNHDKTLQRTCNQVLDSLVGLLSISGLVDALRTLLVNGEDEVRQQMLSSFHQRLLANIVDWQASQKACISLLPQLTSVVRDSSKFPLKIIALACVDCIAEKFGKNDSNTVLTAAKVIYNCQEQGTVDQRFRIAFLLCLATMIEVLQDVILPLVPLVLPKAMDYLITSINEDPRDGQLHNAAYSSICAMLLYIPWIIPDSALEQVLRISYQSANGRMGEDCDNSRLEALELVARQVKPQKLFAAMYQSWKTATSEGSKAVKEYLEILCRVVEQQPKLLIIKQSEILTNILIQAFDLRHIQISLQPNNRFELSEIEEAEAFIFKLGIAIIYKLNDVTFRPMFMKIWEWTVNLRSEKGVTTWTYRRTTTYGFLQMFFGTFKSVVTSYSDIILDDAVSTLQDVLIQDEESKLLWKTVITTLQKSFESDQDEFWQLPCHFSRISETLLYQLNHASETSMISEVIPAITELAIAVDSASHHKALNSAILQYMRSDNVSIRLAAVQCEYSLTVRMGEEWLAFLAEMLPFISELQEDDDESVEQETQKWIVKIEEILGESLSPMLC